MSGDSTAPQNMNVLINLGYWKENYADYNKPNVFFFYIKQDFPGVW